jgi:hypothetical protein
MSKIFIISCVLLPLTMLEGQTPNLNLPTINVRFSILLIPPVSPLLTLEMRTFGDLTVQLETNFVNTHGINLKYFIKERMNGHYVFVGTAFVESRFLRKDMASTVLPYLGYGYAHRFGKNSLWTFDNRIGIGRTTNADSNGIYPIIKMGVGKIF